ncbi:MAG TPA: hypothetical protein PKI71_14250, partial [Candidatus Rifleibacterium sp.]|nr:hypothetical protein [Candidatus Rifleibacterium sp.]
MSIPRGAVEKNFLLQIRKTPINFTSLGLEEDYVQISPLYSLLTPEHAKLLKMPASITIGIDSILAANHFFVAERLDDKWRFLPCNIANSQISIDFSEFSEFVVLKRKSLETVADNAFPELKITPEEVVITGGVFAADSVRIEISCRDDNLANSSTEDLQLEFLAPSAFELSFIADDGQISTQKSSPAPHRLQIDLQNRKLIKEIAGSFSKTYLVSLSLKNQDKNKFPEFMQITAMIKNKNGSVFADKATIRKKYHQETGTATSTGTSTTTQTTTETQTSTGTST